MDNKLIIKLETVENGDLEMISMITKLLEDYFYNFVSFDQKVEISKEEDQYFYIAILNRKTGEEEGVIVVSSSNGKPWILWEDHETGFSTTMSTISFNESKDFQLQLEENFLKLLRKFNYYKKDLFM